MRKSFLPILLVIALVLSTIPISTLANDSEDAVKQYTTTSYGPEYPWWSIYHLTSTAAVDAQVKGGEGGQMVHAMAVSSDGQKLYYGTDTGGIWTSDDGGASWKLSQTGFVVNGAVDIAIDPDDNNTAYAAGMLCAGTMTNDNTGLYRTTDGGAHWSQVLKCNFYYMFTNKVIRFGPSVAQGQKRTIYVGTHSTGIYKSTDGGDNWTNLGCTGDQIEDLYVDTTRMIEVSQQSGVVVSLDGGTTWNQSNSGLPSTQVCSLAVDPANTSTWLVTLADNKKLYKTTDAGATWSVAGDMTSVLDNGQPWKLLFGAWDGNPAHTPVLYIDLMANSGQLRYSTDLGATFQSPVYDQTLALRDQTGYYPEAMAADSVDPWKLWVSIDGTIYKSTTADSVNLVPSSSGNSGMRDYDMLFDDAGNIQYIGVMDHGIYKAVPGYDTDYPPVSHLSTVPRWGGVWSSLGLAMDPNDPQHIFAKVGDWGSNLIIEESKDGGATWTQIEGTGGNYGIEISYNKNDDKVIYAGKLRSDDNGKTWKTLTKTIEAVSPIDNDVVYAVGGTKIFKSTDRGETWEALKPTIGDGVQLITADGLKSDRLWIGSFNTGIYRIDGDTLTHIYTDKLQPGENGGYGIFKIAQDPNNPYHYVAGGCDNNAHGPGAGLFESWDGGDTWELIPGMPGMKDIWRMMFNPVKPLVYVCTSNGTMVYDWSKRTGLDTNPPITPVTIGKYTEDFNDGIAQGWTTVSGAVYGYVSDPVNQVFYTEDWGTPSAIYNWQVAAAPFEYKVDAVAYTDQDGNRMRVIFNYKDASNYDYFDFGTAHPDVQKPTINLKKVVAGIESTIATGETTFNFTGSIATIGIKCSVDGKITVDAIRNGHTTNLFTDIEDETFLSGGKIGVGSQAMASGFFDNVSVANANEQEVEIPTHPITTYTEDFGDAQAQYWELSSGFQVDPSGVMYNDNHAADQIALYNTGIATTPFEYKLDLLTWDGGDANKMRVFFNYRNDMNYEYIEMGGGSLSTIELKKVINGNESTIATSSAQFSFLGPDWTTLDIKCENDGLFNIDAVKGGVTTHLFTNVLNDDGVLFTDVVPSSEGKIGVGTHAGFIAVDSIEVKSIAPTGSIISYTENFHDNAAQGWILSDSLVLSVKCMHNEDFGNPQFAIYDRQIAYAPYDYKIDFFEWGAGDDNRVIFVFGYQDEHNYYYLDIGADPNGSPIYLNKIVDGDTTTIATSSATIGFGNSTTTFDIKYGADGSINIDATQNETTTNLFTGIKDTTFTSGKIGVGTRGGASLYWTNVDVTGTAPAAPTPTPTPTPTPKSTMTSASTPSPTPVNVGTATTTQEGGKTKTTIAFDDVKLDQMFAEEGNNAVITVPVNTKSDVVVGELNGQMISNMVAKQATLVIKTDTVTYTLPAQQIDIDAISKQLGENVELKDIKLQVIIEKSSEETVKVLENTSKKGEFTVLAPPMNFEIKCTSNNKTIEVSKFSAYVERMIQIPDGIDLSKITTGIVLEPDGTVRHVPTQVFVIDGKYYAKISSLTNSTYSVVWHRLEFKDAENHWAKDAINDMGSRMVINGVGDNMFEPDRDISRAEFAAVIVRGLGLKPGTGTNPYKDVNASDWYCGFVQTASEYGIISGYGDGKFDPMDKITREQVMAIVARAMKITGLKVELKSGDVDSILNGFVDSAKSAVWAKESMAACVNVGIVSGKSGKTLAPKDDITRAEVAVIVRRLLQKSSLIN